MRLRSLSVAAVVSAVTLLGPVPAMAASHAPAHGTHASHVKAAKDRLAGERKAVLKSIATYDAQLVRLLGSTKVTTVLKPRTAQVTTVVNAARAVLAHDKTVASAATTRTQLRNAAKEAQKARRGASSRVNALAVSGRIDLRVSAADARLDELATHLEALAAQGVEVSQQVAALEGARTKLAAASAAADAAAAAVVAAPAANDVKINAALKTALALAKPATPALATVAATVEDVNAFIEQAEAGAQNPVVEDPEVERTA